MRLYQSTIAISKTPDVSTLLWVINWLFDKLHVYVDAFKKFVCQALHMATVGINRHDLCSSQKADILIIQHVISLALWHYWANQ